MPVGIYKRQKRIIKCKECGNEVTVYSGAAKYCSDCKLRIKRRAHKKDSREARYKKRMELELKCENCGKDIRKYYKAKKYCPECRGIVAEKQRKDYYQENREQYLEYAKEYYNKPGNKERHRKHARAHYEKKRIDNLP